MFRPLAMRAACALALSALIAAPALAQDQAQQPDAQAPAAAAAPAAPEASPSHTQAAIEFLQLSGVTKGFEEMIPQFLDQVRLRYVGQRPEIAEMINDASLSLVPEFVKRRDDLNKELAKIYTARFTEDELNQLVAFYKTPAGQKFASVQADVLQASVPVVQGWSRKLSTDMAQRIKEEVGKKGQKL
jgi:uncharacterized protein